jgi:type IV pilus assembly protein PilF
MKRYRWGVCLVLAAVVMLSGCASDRQLRKTQSQDLRGLGEAYMGEGNFIEALRTLLEAEKLDSKDAFLQNDLGLVYMARDRNDMAVAHFQKAIALKPDYAPAHNNLGAAYMALKNWDAAIATFKKLTGNLLYATPQYPLANLGWAYYNKGDYQTALGYYRKALEMAPQFVIGLLGMGRTYLAMGKNPEALQALEKAATLAPRLPEIYLALGTAYKNIGAPNKARSAYEKVVALAPGTDLAKAAASALAGL